MNRDLVTAFWRQRAMSPLRIVFLLMAWGLPLLTVLFAPGMGLTPMRDVVGITMVLAVGMIGMDVSSGVLQLLFARPVTRSEYVVSRWLAVWAAASVLVVLQLAGAWAILTMRGAPVDRMDLALTVVKRVLEAGQLAGVMALLSALVNGAADLGLWFLAQLTGGILAMAAQVRGWPWLGRVADAIGKIVNPNLQLSFGPGAAGSLLPVTTALAVTAVALVLAVLLVNRKELSYASAGG